MVHTHTHRPSPEGGRRGRVLFRESRDRRSGQWRWGRVIDEVTSFLVPLFFVLFRRFFSALFSLRAWLVCVVVRWASSFSLLQATTVGRLKVERGTTEPSVRPSFFLLSHALTACLVPAWRDLRATPVAMATGERKGGRRRGRGYFQVNNSADSSAASAFLLFYIFIYKYIRIKGGRPQGEKGIPGSAREISRRSVPENRRRGKCCFPFDCVPECMYRKFQMSL